MEDGGPASAGASPMEGEETPDSGMEQDGENKTFFLPREFVSDYDCKPGDKITLEVVNVDKDGDKEVKVSGFDHKGGGGMSIMDDLRASKDSIMPGMNGASQTEA